MRPGHAEELERENERLRLQVSKLQGELGRNKAVREDDGESTKALVNEVSSLEAEKERLEGELAKVAEQEEKWKKEISASAVTIRVQALLKDGRRGFLRGAKCHLCQLILTACIPQRQHVARSRVFLP